MTEKLFAITPDGQALHRPDCRIILGYDTSKNSVREWPDIPSGIDRYELEKPFWLPNGGGFDSAAWETYVATLPKKRAYPKVEYLTTEEAIEEWGRHIFRRCQICAPDFTVPKPRIRRRRSGLGWPSTSSPGKCLKGSREWVA